MDEFETDTPINKFIAMKVDTTLDANFTKKTSIELTMPDSNSDFKRVIMINSFDREQHSELINQIYVFAELRHRLIGAVEELFSYMDPASNNNVAISQLYKLFNNVLGLLNQLVDEIDPEKFSVKNSEGKLLQDEKDTIKEYFGKRDDNVIINSEGGISFVEIAGMPFFNYIGFITEFIEVEDKDDNNSESTSPPSEQNSVSTASTDDNTVNNSQGDEDDNNDNNDGNNNEDEEEGDDMSDITTNGGKRRGRTHRSKKKSRKQTRRAK